MPSFLIQWTSHLKQIILNLDDIFTKKIEDLYKKKQFEQIKFEISTLEEKDYIEKATNLVLDSNLKNLNTLRNSLRKKAMVSPLFNTSELAENFSKELIKISNRDHS